MTRTSTAIAAAIVVALAGLSTPAAIQAADPVAQRVSASSTWLRVEASNDRLASLLGRSAGAIDYGSFQWLPAAGVDVHALRERGIAVTEITEPFVLDLGGTRFDPLLSTPAPITAAGSASDDGDWRLVQFDGPIKPEWLSRLRADGVHPAQYVHPYSYVVWSSAADLARAASADGVRWSGDFQTAFRVQPQQRGLDSTLRSTMALVSRHRDPTELAAAITSLGARIETASPLDSEFDVLQLQVPGDRYVALASIAGVYTVQEIPGGGGPRGEMSNQAIVGAYGAAPNYTIIPGYASWLDALGYDGTGVIVSVVDGGFRTTHLDLATQVSPCTSAGATPTSCSTANDSHGTHVAGAIGGSGASGVLLNGFRRGLGVAPGAKLVQQRYSAFLNSSAGTGFMIADGMLKLYKESSLSNAVLTNNSWGPTSTPQGYDIPTQQADMVIRDANADVAGNQQLLNVWSIMNGNGDGAGACAPSSLGSPDEAKNLFGIGSTNLQNSSGGQLTTILSVSSNSAHGNACDGRRVPQIVAPGCRTDSTSNTNDTAFAFLCGTSMASPVVTGASAVFVEKYRADHAGATPSPAMIKAAFTAVATDLAGFNDADGRVMGHRPDRFQGYGRIDLDAVVDSPDPIVSIDQSELLQTTGSSWTRTITAADATRPVRIMLAWTDAKGHGLGGTSPAWVNNLDLSAAIGATTYRGNVIGSDGFSASGGTADAMNNLEGIFLRPDQLTAPIELRVLAANLAADAIHPYVPGTPAQDFALVCYNCSDAPLGNADLALSLGGIPAIAAPGELLDLVASVVNFGSDAATGVRLTFTLPPQLTYVSSRLARGTGEWNCTAAGSTVTCLLSGDPLPANSFANVLDLTTRVAASTTVASLTTTATLSAPSYIDANAANNSASVVTTVNDVVFANGFD